MTVTWDLLMQVTDKTCISYKCNNTILKKKAVFWLQSDFESRWLYSVVIVNIHINEMYCARKPEQQEMQ